MNTSGGYAGAIGGKVKLKKHTGGKKSGGSMKQSAKMKPPKHGQQEFPGMWLSAYGKRRKAKMRGI